MSIKEALEQFKALYDEIRATNSLKTIAQYERNLRIIDDNLHMYYISYRSGDTDWCNELMDEILEILGDYDLEVDELPVDIINGAGGGSGIVPVSGIWNWNGTAHDYRPYESQQSFLSFDSSTTSPTRTDRLNLNGNFHATELTGDNVTVRNGCVYLYKQSLTANTVNDVRLRADGAGVYIDRYSGTAWVTTGLDITF